MSIQIIKEAYAALNRNDIPAFVSIFAPEIERVEWLGSPQVGTYQGLEAVTTHVIAGRSSWAEGSCEPERFVVTGNRIIVFTHVHVRLKVETDWREGHTVDVFTFQNGKAIQFYTFLSEQQALEWANHDGQHR